MLPDATSCNLGSINVSEFVCNNDIYGTVFDEDEFEKQIYRAIYYLDLVIDTSKYPLKKIENRTKAIRPVGLGVMGLADLAIKLGITYGNNKEFSELCTLISKILARASLKATIELAKLKGSFPEYESITKKILEKPIGKNTELIDVYNAMINDSLPLTFINAMKYLYEKEPDLVWLSDMLQTGLRNSRRLTVAPTGSISMICNTSSSIEPNFAFKWDRLVTVDENKKEKLTFYHKLYNEENEKKGLLVEANTLDKDGHLTPVRIFAQVIDSGISKTINLPEEANVDDIKYIYEYCYDNNIKGITIYRNNSRKEQPIQKIEEENTKKNIRERENVLLGYTQKGETNYGNLYATMNFDSNGSPVELFIVIGKNGSLSKSLSEALSRTISISLQNGVDIDILIKTLSGIADSEIPWVYEDYKGQEYYCKSIPDMVSMMMTSLKEYYAISHSNNNNDAIAKEKLEEQIRKSNEEHDKHVNDKHKIYCPECGSMLVYQGSCNFCPNCGWSSCK